MLKCPPKQQEPELWAGRGLPGGELTTYGNFDVSVDVPTPQQRAAIRMRIAVSARTAVASCQRMFSAMGGSILPSGSRAERLLRDFYAMSSHLLLQPESIGEAYGRLLLGMDLPAGARL